MSAIDELQRLSRSYIVHSCAALVTYDIALDPDLYDRDTLQVQGQTPEGTAKLALIEMAKLRNDRPRLVSITVIAGLEVAS